MTDRFGSLRSILQQTPSAETWDALCDELALWDDEALERDAAPYASGHLERWPDDVLRAPSWADATAWRTLGLAGATLRLANHLEAHDASQLQQIIDRLANRRALSLRLDLDADSPEEAAQLIALACQLHLRGLELRGWGAQLDAMWSALASCAPTLVTLELSQDELTTLPLERIAPLLTSLTTLKLTECALSRATLTAIAAKQLLPSLTALHLDCCKLDARGMTAWLHSPSLARLTTLVLPATNADARIAQAIATSPSMRALTTLDLSDTHIGTAGARALADSPHLARLTELDLSHAGVSEALGALFSSPHLRALHTLRVAGSRITRPGAEQIADADWPPALICPPLPPLGLPAARALARCPGLRTLAQHSVILGHDSLEGSCILLASPHLTGLRSAELLADASSLVQLLQAISRNPAMGALEELSVEELGYDRCPSLTELAASPHLTSLRTLRLSSSRNDAALHALASSAALPALSELYIGYSAPDADALHALLQSPLGARLRTLELAAPSLGDAAMQTIARATHLTALEALDASGDHSSPDTFAALISSPHIQQLQRLALRGPLGKAGLTALAATPLLARHHSTYHAHGTCSLQRCQIDAAALPALLDGPAMPLLHTLDLGENPLGDEGAQALADHPALRHLTALHLPRTAITLHGVHALAQSPHLTRLTTLRLDLGDTDLNAQAHAILLASPHLSTALRASLTPR